MPCTGTFALLILSAPRPSTAGALFARLVAALLLLLLPEPRAPLLLPLLQVLEVLLPPNCACARTR